MDGSIAFSLPGDLLGPLDFLADAPLVDGLVRLGHRPVRLSRRARLAATSRQPSEQGSEEPHVRRSLRTG
jgi:hypothetical protein